MLTTGLRITPLRNEDRYALAFLLAALQLFFYYLFANCSFFSFFLLSGVFLLLSVCMYVCMYLRDSNCGGWI